MVQRIAFLMIAFQIFRKDVRLPVQLQRAMAAEAEAAREARAKVKSVTTTSFIFSLTFRHGLLFICLINCFMP